jgi:hypothetical protein
MTNSGQAKGAAANDDLGLLGGIDWDSSAMHKLPDPTRLFSFFVIGFPIVRFLLSHDFDVSLIMSGFVLDPFVIGCFLLASVTSYVAASGKPTQPDLPIYDRWASEWYWWNACLYHGILDGATGTFQQVPVMLQQYQELDRRFSTHHAVPWTVGLVEFCIMQPLCLLLVWSIHRRRPTIRYPLELVLGCCHIFGMIMFVVAEYYEGQLNVPANDPVGAGDDRWANIKFNFYHCSYYWFGFWFCNLVWLWIPLLRMYRAWKEIARSFEATAADKAKRA